jgi:hypothetical protein
MRINFKWEKETSKIIPVIVNTAKKNKKDSQSGENDTEKNITVKEVNTLKYFFKLTRYKNDDDHRESLKIEIFFDNDPYGEIYTYIYKLDQDIKRLMEYGVVFDDLIFLELVQTIKDVYIELEPKKVEVADEDIRLSTLLESVGEYIGCDNEKDDQNFYYVPVSDFNDIAGDCGYNSFELIELKKRLGKKYIYSVSGRLAVLARIKGKPTRVIAFKKEEIEDYIPKKVERADNKGNNVSKNSIGK